MLSVGGPLALALHAVPRLSHATLPTARRGPCTLLELPPAGVVVTVVSGVAILLRPDSALRGLLEGDPEPSEEARMLTAELCRSDGWDIRLSIGSSVARALGGNGVLARGDSETLVVPLRVSLKLDERFRAYPQGTAHLRSPSPYFSSAVGLWAAEVLDESDGLVPSALELNLACAGLEVPGGGRVEAGPLYLNSALRGDPQASRVAALTSGRAVGNTVLRFDNGRVVINEYSALGAAVGISEAKVVGGFEARPAQPASQSPVAAPPLR